MNYYWLCPDENFSPQSTATRWRCDHFSKKWPKSKSDTTFTHKKTSVTPTFCKRNFSRMNRFGLMNFLSSTAPSSVVWRNRKGPKKVASIEIWKHIFIACLSIDLWQLLCQKMKMDYYRFFSRNFVQFGIIWVLSPKMTILGIFPTQFSSLSWNFWLKMAFGQKCRIWKFTLKLSK